MPDLVSDEQLGEWEALADAATEGPWRLTDERAVLGPANPAHGLESWVVQLVDLIHDADAEFIAAARDAVPLLVRALRDARAEVERLTHLGAVHHADIGEWRAERDTWRDRALQAEVERDEWHAEYAQMRLNWDTAREFNNRAMEGLAERDALRTENERLRTRADRLQADTYRLRLQLSAALPSDPEHPERACGCRRCDDADRDTLPWLERIGRTMVVCPECGNKRCPRAEWHGNDCTGRALAAPTGQEGD